MELNISTLLFFLLLLFGCDCKSQKSINNNYIIKHISYLNKLELFYIDSSVNIPVRRKFTYFGEGGDFPSKPRYIDIEVSFDSTVSLPEGYVTIWIEELVDPQYINYIDQIDSLPLNEKKWVPYKLVYEEDELERSRLVPFKIIRRNVDFRTAYGLFFPILGIKIIATFVPKNGNQFEYLQQEFDYTE